MSGRAAFEAELDVSRETMERLDVFEALLIKWSASINLVAKTTMDELWTRHFADSAAAFNVAVEHPGRWLDIGSGAGFPGLVLGVMAVEKAPDVEINCIESDIRKCEFMRTVVRNLGLPVKVFSRRIEETPPQQAEVITARALSSLDRLFEYVDRHVSPTGIAVLHKGDSWQEEVEAAQRHWTFDLQLLQNQGPAKSTLLKIKDLSRV